MIESDEVRELWNILKGNAIGYTLQHSLQTVIGSIIGINAKWMYLNEVTGKESTIKSFNSQDDPNAPILKIGVFASELFFFNNQQERIRLMKRFHNWYLIYTSKISRNDRIEP